MGVKFEAKFWLYLKIKLFKMGLISFWVSFHSSFKIYSLFPIDSDWMASSVVDTSNKDLPGPHLRVLTWATTIDVKGIKYRVMED